MNRGPEIVAGPGPHKIMPGTFLQRLWQEHGSRDCDRNTAQEIVAGTGSLGDRNAALEIVVGTWLHRLWQENGSRGYGRNRVPDIVAGTGLKRRWQKQGSSDCGRNAAFEISAGTQLQRLLQEQGFQILWQEQGSGDRNVTPENVIETQLQRL